MKYLCYFTAMALLALLPLSCASRAVPLAGVYPEGAETPGPHGFPEEPADPFERALWHIKMDSPLVSKYVQLDSGAIAAVKGEYRLGEYTVPVVYDLAGAGQKSGGFQITFSAEDSAGVMRNGELFWAPGADETGLLLSLDDDHWQTWRRYFDLFESFGARITFFVQGSIDEAQGDLGDFCAEALRRGHDIGFHSVHHYDLTGVSPKVFDSETIDPARTFRDADIPLSAFAFPFGFSRPWMREYLSPVFGITRGYGTGFRLYRPEEISGGYIVSKAIDNIMYDDDGEFEKDMRLMLLAAKFTGQNNIIPFTSHDIADTSKWAISRRRLEVLLRTAKELKLRFYTYRDFRDSP
jgi:peptidoglycan/xylan/chitin deacetylase (PgdA/CDA1 family)